jgi:hypothetical protein
MHESGWVVVVYGITEKDRKFHDLSQGAHPHI